jgi:hypothetical protein
VSKIIANARTDVRREMNFSDVSKCTVRLLTELVLCVERPIDNVSFVDVETT